MAEVSTALKKKRILLVVRWPVGGIRTFLRYVYTSFDSEIWQFTILVPDISEVEALAEDLKDLHVDFVLTGLKPSVFEFSYAVIRQLLSKKFDIVHSHGFTSAICSSLPSTILSKKHLVTSHDVLNAEQFMGLKGEVKKIALGFMLGRATRIHSVSNDAQDNLLYFLPNLNKDRCLVIPNGIETTRFLAASNIDFSADIGEEDVFCLGFFGRFMNQKGFRYIVEAIEILAADKSLKRQPLVLAFGWGGFVEREKRDIKQRGLEKFFRFMPFESNVAGAIKTVDVVVMPSLWEACGLLAMETLVCGTPLIATECIGLREVIKDTPAVVVPAKNGEAIALAITDMINVDQKMNFQCFVEKAAERYGADVQSDAMKSLYLETIDCK